MSHKKLLILILFTLAFWAGLFSYASAGTFADCPTSYGTIVCGAGEQYCGTCTTGIADNRSPQWTLNCGTCSWSCPAPNVSCGASCGPAYSGENPTCVTKKVTTDQCGNCTTTCRTAGDTYCSSTGTCLTPTACAGGSTWNGCACVANPYIIASPTSAQSAYINVTGNTTVGGDLYMSSSKALRVDGSGVTNFNLGNWGTGATGFNLIVNGGLNMSGNTISNTGRVQFRLNGPLDGVNAIETVNTDQDLIAYAQRNIYLVVDEQIEATPPQGGGDLIVTKDSQGGPPYLVVKNDGRVGIGTLTPGALLDVQGQSMFGSASQVVASGQNLIYGNVDTTSAGNLLLLQTEGVNRFQVDKNGNTTTTGHFATTELCLNNDCKTAWPAGGTGYWTVTGNDIINNNLGNVIISGDLLLKYKTGAVKGDITIQTGGGGTGGHNGSDLHVHAGDGIFSGGIDRPGGDLYLFGGAEDADSATGALNGDVILANTGSATRGKVGVGTASPNAMLHVYKTSGTNAEIDIQSIAGAGAHWGIYQERSNGDLRFWNSNNRVIFTSSGDVGIGTTLPASKLDVSSTGNTSIKVRSTNDNAALILSADTGNTALTGDQDPVVRFESVNNFRSEIRYDESAGVLKFGNIEDGSQFSINGSGRVGIGTLAPGALLDVQGQSMFGSASQVVASGQNLIYGNVDTTSAGNLLLLQTESVDRFKVDKNGNATTTGHFSTTELCLNNDCKTAWPAGGTGYWTQTGDNLYPTNINSQVGIGTTNPSVYSLMVNNTTNGWPVLFKTNTANGSNVLIRVNHLLASADPRISFGDDNPVPNTLGKNFWNIGMDNSDSDKFKISTDVNSQLDLSTKLTIDYTSGNLGIGTSAPGAKLEVNGQSMFGSATQVVASGQNLVYGNIDTTSIGNLLLLQTESVDRLKVDKDGGLTLSSLSGGANRCVQSDVNGKLVNASCTASNPFIQNGNSFAALAVLGTNDNNALAFETNGAERVRIDTTGNVGIGINNPDESLYVYRDAAGPKDAQIKLYTNYGAGSNPWAIFYVGDNDPATVGYDDRGDLRFWTGNNRVVFTHDGAVVAGGLTPSQPRPGGGQWKFWSEGDIGINGSVYAYGGNFYVSGADVAEEFESDKELAEGTVVIMGDGGYKSVKASNKSYDQTVMGVVSDDAGIVMGHISEDNKAQIAMVGVVGVKVTNENGAIKKGDLLVTSSLSGYAMRSTKNIVGTVIGKALQDFDGYKGNIKALINLQ